MPLEKFDEELITHIAGDCTDERKKLIHLVYEINRELLMGEAGWRMDRCADIIASYVAAREKALVERIVDIAMDWHVEDDAIDAIRDAAREEA